MNVTVKFNRLSGAGVHAIPDANMFLQSVLFSSAVNALRLPTLTVKTGL